MICKKTFLVIILVALVFLSCNLPFIDRQGEQEDEDADFLTEETGTQPDEVDGETGESTFTPQPTWEPPPDGPAAVTSLSIPLRVYNTLDVSRNNEPLTSGVPLPRALGITDTDSLLLVDASGEAVPAQFTSLARWGGSPDDSAAPLRWVLVDFQTSVGPAETAYYYLQEGGPGPEPQLSLLIDDTPEAVLVDTGVAQYRIDKTTGNLGGDLHLAGLAGRALGEDGTIYAASGVKSVIVKLAGALRASIEVKGTYRSADGLRLVDYTARYWFFDGQPVLRLFYTVENNNLCLPDEGGQIYCYDIGSEGSVTLKDLSLILATDLQDGLRFEVPGEQASFADALDGDLLVYQDSSGTDRWDYYPNKVDWDGKLIDTRPRMQSYVSFRGYRTTLNGETLDSGEHAAGWLGISSGEDSWGVGVRDFWQNFPKALRASPDGSLEIGLFPDEYGPDDYGLILRPGEHKTHEIWLAPSTNLSPYLSPMFAQAPPEWYVDSGGFGLTALRNWEDWPEHEQYIDDQLVTSPAHEGWDQLFANLFAAIEGTDFYGIFDYGDWPIDYEGVLVSPLGPKYDNDQGMWLQWARGADPRWFTLAERADRHSADIDILHNLHEPRHWGDGIMFGHSYHDEEGFLNPHRNYGGASPDTAFGMDGLLLTYYLTGYEKTFDAALEFAEAIAYRTGNDYHLCDFFPAGECSGEGWNLFEDGLYGANCRPAANSLSVLVSAYRATGNQRYLNIADAIVDWARAENQPYLNGPTGEQRVMRPWMLNMYLAALADYLEMRGEFGLPDTYGARESYLAYADWLHDYPWMELDSPGSGPRAAYPYEWWFDERQGDPNDEWSEGNNIPSVNNWLLLGADAMAYAYHLSADASYLDWAAQLFQTGVHDPFYEGDDSLYTETKQTINSISFGHIFLYEWGTQHR
ncbi:MAG: hypothetical protein MUO76_07985 [Anaerolineaceae bacterium]|nr:hypothetical protein [Anaerolineaceae bacterium]